MNKKIAFLFPGQGAQYPGMGRDFFDHYPEARAVFEEADQILGIPFSKTIFEGSQEELLQTKNSQLAIFITSIAILRVIETLYPELRPSLCGGLSLGEYSALVAAHKLSFADALRIVKVRGESMQKACETHPGTMRVVLGLEVAAIEEALTSVEGAWIANLNCPGQVVIAGTAAGIEKATEVLSKKGAKRILSLPVSGAFHSSLMQSAQDHMRPLIEKSVVITSLVGIVMNVKGNVVEHEQNIRRCMIDQVTHPVYWQKGIEKMAEMGVELFIEIGPGKTLAGMNKKIGLSVPTISVEKKEDLETLAEGVLDAAAQK